MEYTLLLDSRDRHVSSTVQTAQYELDRPIHNLHSVVVNWVQLYNTFWNVTTSNNTLAVVFGGTTTVKTVPPGFYTPQLLVQQVDVLLKQVSATLAVTYQASSQTANYTLPAASLNVLQSTARDLLGLTELTSTTGTFQAFVNTSLPQSVLLFSPELQPDGGAATVRTNRNALDLVPLLQVPIFAGHGSLNFWQPNFLVKHSCSKETLSQFSLSMLMGGTSEAAVGGIDYQVSLTFTTGHP